MSINYWVLFIYNNIDAMSFMNAIVKQVALAYHELQDIVFSSLHNIYLSPFVLRLHESQTLAATYKSQSFCRYISWEGHINRILQ